jgi:PAS domain S-box-containing protein
MSNAVTDIELTSLAACWLAMSTATTLDEIETAAIRGLVELIDVRIAYVARREHGVWKISESIGLIGEIARVAVPEDQIPYAATLNSGQTICFEDPATMGTELAVALEAVGIQAVFAVPIMRGTECIGALAIAQPFPTMFSERDRALASLFTSHLSALVGKREVVQSLELLAESVPVIVLRTDPSGWINWYNRRWYEFTGQTKEEAAGWGWQTAHHPIDFQRVIQEWPKALATGEPIEIEFRLKRFDGVYHWHLARVEPVRNDNGLILSWYGTVVDIEAQKAALERTNRIVETLQTAFLPLQLPQRSTMRIDAKYVSAEVDAHVGGDWYDAFELADGSLGFSIGDVAGHGLAASLTVGKLRQAILTLAHEESDPAAILRKVDRMLRIQEPGMFVTALVGFVDRDETTLRYASAGHPPPIVAYTADAPAQVLATGGPPLGVTDDLILVTHHVPIRPHSVVVLYTDGMTEFNRDAISGEERLRSVIPTVVGASLRKPAQVIYDLTLDGVAPPDDAAVLVLQFSAADAALDDGDEPSAPRDWRFHASDAQAAHVARREIGAYIHRIGGDTEAAYASELIVGEVLANTVEHAPGLVHLVIEWADAQPVLIVRDSGPGLGDVRTTLPEDIMNEGSRGLFLVHSLASSVAVVAVPGGGTELRIVLPIMRAAPMTLDINDISR